MVLISELRESRVTYGSVDSGDLSLRDGCLGKPRSTNKRSFIPSNVESRWKGDSGTEQLQEGYKEGTQKTVRKVQFASFVGHPPHSIVRVHHQNVRESNLKWGHKYE